MTCLIIGKRSYLTRNLVKNIPNTIIIPSQTLLQKKFLKIKLNTKNVNIIFNHSYPLTKILNTKNFSIIINHNIIVLINLVKLIIKKKIKVNKFIFTSSSSVYGLKVKEKKIFKLKNNRMLYASTKFFCENFLISMMPYLNCKLVILRIFNMYGPGEKVSLISKIIEKKIKNKKININPNKKIFRDFIHVDDVVKIYKEILLNKQIEGVFDIGTSKSTNIHKLISKYFIKDDQITIKNTYSNLDYSKADMKILSKFININKLINLNNYIKEELIKNKNN